jgi:uncharacterized protein (TIGR00661 family)
LGDQKKINNLPLRILVAPLEWGLGHATRCIPLINELLSQKCEVFIAAEGGIYHLLKREFPTVNFLLLRGYKVRVSRRRTFFSLKMVSLLPRLLYIVYRENQWLRKAVAQHRIDAVISDNRPGLYNKKLKCAYITHQLRVKTGNLFTEKIADFIHRYFIRKFDECWIPDFKNDGIAGELSHIEPLPKNVKYIGAISRLNKIENQEKKYDLLLLLSGPEPQRTIFEKKLLTQVLSYKKKVLLVRGLPGTEKILKSQNDSLEIVNHIPSDQLNIAIEQSEIVVSRSGYTTIMDLLKLDKKAILVPTPGQKEQEYLAVHLMKKNIFFCLDQKNFNLDQTLKKFEEFLFSKPSYDMEQYKFFVSDFIQSLR